MEIIPLAAESMGTRSMATFVETNDLRILFDPGASLLQDKKGLPPHQLETWRLKQHQERIDLFSQKADIVILSHYHRSHMSNVFSVYTGKTIYMKNPNQQTDPEQRRIAFGLMQQFKGLAKEIFFADGRKVRHGQTELTFSEAVPHGTERGSVVQVCIRTPKDSFLITSDVEGPSSEKACQFIVEQQPDILYLDGFSTAQPGFSKIRFEQGMSRVRGLFDSICLKNLILDHHFLRDSEWESKFAIFTRTGKEKGFPVLTAAELRGEAIDVFEARREKLYAHDVDF